MDESRDRAICVEGEAGCDNCTRERQLATERPLRQPAQQPAHKTIHQPAHRTIHQTIDPDITQQQSHHPAVAQQHIRALAAETERLRSFVEDWASGCCVICRLQRRAAYLHGLDQCPYDGATVLREARSLRDQLWGQRRLQSYSGCFGCGLPQRLCDSWVENEGGGFGRAGRTVGWQCRSKGFLESVLISFLTYFKELAFDIVQGLRSKNKASNTFSLDEELVIWLGRKVRLHGLESNNLCRAVFDCWKSWTMLEDGLLVSSEEGFEEDSGADSDGSIDSSL
jgi:hypothetical protein